jgi:hypothetical protein
MHSSEVEVEGGDLSLEMSDEETLTEKLINGVSYETISLSHNVSRSTFEKLKNGIEIIKKCYPSANKKPKRTLALPELEKALLIWFHECKHQRIKLSQKMMQEKALSLHNLIYPKPNEKKHSFTGSKGFMQRFIRRNKLNINHDDRNAVPEFLENIKKTFTNGRYTKHQFYTASEAGLFYKSLPNGPLNEANKVSASSTTKEARITIMPCSNAAGTHQLPLLIIGKAPKPDVLNKVYYVSSKSALMTRDIFTLWFHTEFVPQVKMFLHSMNLPEKAILFIDTCRAHSPNLRDGDIIVKCLPQNTSSLIQPMNQGPIAAIKNKYRSNIVRNICHDPAYFRKLNIKEVITVLAKVWTEVINTVESSWNNFELFPQIEKQKETDKEEIINELFKKKLECNQHNLDEWLHSDDSDVGIQIISDQEIVQEVLGDDDTSDVTTLDPNIQMDVNLVPKFESFLLNHPQVYDYEKNLLKSIFERVYNISA